MDSRVQTKASQLGAALRLASPKLPTAIRTSLGRDGAVEALSVALAAQVELREPERAQLPSDLRAVVALLDSAARVMPESFAKGIAAAGAGNTAGSAKYFVAAFADMPGFQVNLVAGFLDGLQFRELTARLLLEGEPAPEVASQQLPAPEAEPATLPAAPMARARARVDRFDRIDHPRASAPRPPDDLVSRGTLVRAGWSGGDADRLLSGPKGHTHTVLMLRSWLRAYAALSLAGRRDIWGLIDRAEESFNPRNRGELDIDTKIPDFRGVDPMDGSLIEKYKEFAVYDRKRIVRWIYESDNAATVGE